MKKQNWIFILSLAMTITSIFAVIAIREQKNSEIKELESQIDNLSTESFLNGSEVGKYDLALDSLKIVNPKAEKQFQEILNSGQYE